MAPRVEVVEVRTELPKAKYLVFRGELLDRAVVERTLEALGEGDSVGEEICDQVPCRVIRGTGSELKLAKAYKAVGPQSGAVVSVQFRNTEGQG